MHGWLPYGPGDSPIAQEIKSAPACLLLSSNDDSDNHTLPHEAATSFTSAQSDLPYACPYETCKVWLPTNSAWVIFFHPHSLPTSRPFDYQLPTNLPSFQVCTYARKTRLEPRRRLQPVAFCCQTGPPRVDAPSLLLFLSKRATAARLSFGPINSGQINGARGWLEFVLKEERRVK